MGNQMKFDYDAIIIGSGIGGLITGAYLAEQGAKVLICEHHRQPGGCFTSFKRKGYTFDGGIQGCEDGGVFFHLFELRWPYNEYTLISGWSIMISQPYPRDLPEYLMIPSATANTGVPGAAKLSSPV